MTNGDNTNRSEDKFIVRLSKINEVRSVTLKKLKVFNRLNQALLQNEAKRLESKLGKNHPRVQKLKACINDNVNLVRGLEVEEEISKIRVPEVPQGGALVHGRITDNADRSITGLSVFAEDEKGQPLRAFGGAETDASGYYAIQLDEGTLKKLEETEVYLTVGATLDKVIHREKKPLALKPNAQVIINITLDRSTLRPIAQPTSPSPRKPSTKESGKVEEAVAGKEEKAEEPEGEEEAKIDIGSLNGIGPKVLEKLREAGIKDIQAFVETSDDKLEEIIGKATLNKVKKQNETLLEKAKKAYSKNKKE